jgi:hypothetical protein
VVVGGIELSSMSTTVVTPPDKAARVPIQKPSQSVRPGLFKYTCVLHRTVEHARSGSHSRQATQVYYYILCTDTLLPYLCGGFEELVVSVETEHGLRGSNAHGSTG